MKTLSFILWKRLDRLFGQPNKNIELIITSMPKMAFYMILHMSQFSSFCFLFAFTASVLYVVIKQHSPMECAVPTQTLA